MKLFTAYKTATGEILRTGSCADSDFELQVQEGETVIEGTANDIIQYVLNGEITDYTGEELAAKTDLAYGCKWQMPEKIVVQDLTDAEITAYLATQARAKRDRLLNESIIWSDTSYTGDVLASWLAYREVLKNIPSQAGFPGSIVWPTKPA